MARLFDSYVMVDWSAASKPATGADSIWIGALTPDSRLKLAFKASNPPTRAKALEELTDLLGRCLKRGDRVLMGMDFPLGFPAGAADALKLKGEAPWRSVRDFLLKEMKDKSDNSNNRFALAARMNRLMSEGPFPFWGCSKKDELTTLSIKKTREHGPKDVAEFRIVETHAAETRKARPQPVWKIAYAGAVGGQTLTGVPAIERLREKFPALKVWPFELPLAKLDEEALGDARIVVAEIYPSLVAPQIGAQEIKDEAQVRTMAEWFAERDANGKLPALFASEAKLTDAQKTKVTQEEGWILGYSADFFGASRNPGLKNRSDGRPICGKVAADDFNLGRGPMNKSDLIKSIADANGIKLTEATRLVDAVFDTITDNLRNGEQVAISGFGTFVTKSRAARDGRNPATGNPIKIAARTTAAFKPAAAMKDLK